MGDPLATLTQLPTPKPGTYTRRARSLVPGERANTLPPLLPKEKVFRIGRDAGTIREWAWGNGYDLAEKGPIPKLVREAWDEWLAANDVWTLKIITTKTKVLRHTYVSQFLKLLQGDVKRAGTTDPDMVREPWS